MTQHSAPETAADPLVASAARGRSAWRRLGLRLSAVTPSQVAQLALALAAVYLIGWLAWTARLALLPFALGAALAYIMLPVVNRLDRVLPRWMASLATMAAATALIVYLLAQMIPLAANQLNNVALAVPTDEEFEGYADMLAREVQALPRPVQPFVNRWLESTIGNARNQLDTLAERGANLALSSVLRLFNVLGFVLGFLVIPTWLLSVLNAQKRGTVALDRMLPSLIRDDFWAVVRITDHAIGTFVRGQFVVGLAVGALTYLGLEIIAALVNVGGDYILVLALFSGIMALIPTLGPLLGSLPVVLLALTVSPETAAAVVVMYVLVWLIVGRTLSRRIRARLLEIHPAIMIVILVAVSQLGFLWVLLAAPIVRAVRDLYRYVNGRIADPPRPAGWLPYAPPPVERLGSARRPIPIAYRHGRARRRASR